MPRPRSIPRSRASENGATSTVETGFDFARLLQELGSRLVTEENIGAIYEEILAAAIRLTSADAGFVQTLDAETGELVLLTASGLDHEITGLFQRISADSPTSCGRALASNARVFMEFHPDDGAAPGPQRKLALAGFRTAQSTPLVGRSGRLIGMLTTHWRGDHRAGELEIRYLDLLVRQTADLIKHRHLDRERRKETEKLERALHDANILQKLSTRLIGEDNIHLLYDEIVKGAMALMDAPMGCLQMLSAEEGELELLVAHGFAPGCVDRWQRLRTRHRSETTNDAESPARIVIEDIDGLPDTEDLEIYRDCGVRAAQFTPLISRTGRLVGLISTQWSRPHVPEDHELRLLDILARQAADLIERAQVEEQRSEVRRRQEFLLRLGDALRPLADALEVQGTASRLLGEHFGANRVGYAEAREDGETIEVPPHFTRDVPDIGGRYRIPDFGGAIHRAFHQGKTVVIADTANDPALSASESYAHRQLQIGAVLAKPLHKGGKLLALLFVHFKDPRSFIRGEIELLDEVAERTWDAVERARTEQALWKSRTQLQTLFDAAPVGIFLVDSTLRLLAANPVALPAFGEVGTPVGGSLAEHLPDFLSSHPREEVLAQFRITIATGEHRFHSEWRTKDGTTGDDRVHEWQIHRVPLPDGASGAVCYFREISAQVRAREMLVASESRYRTLFNSIDEGFCIAEILFDDNGAPRDYRFIEVNPAFRRHTGLEDVEGKTMVELIPDQDTHWFETYGKVALTGEAIRFVAHSRPMARWFDVYAFRIGDSRSRLVGILFTDITSRRLTEERLKRSARFDAFRVNLSHALRSTRSASLVRTKSIRLLGMHLKASRVVHLEAAGGGAESAFGLRNSFHAPDQAPLDEGFISDDFGPQVIGQLRSGLTSVVRDVAADPRLDSTRVQELWRRDIRAFIAVPLFRGERLVAIISVLQERPRDWASDEVSLVEEAARHTWEVVERARSEHAIRESDQRLRVALESAQMAAWDWDIRSDTLRWNARHFLILGLEPDGNEKNTGYFLGFVHPDDRSGLQSAFTRAIENGGSFRHEFRIIRADNHEIRWMCVFGQTVGSRNGRATRMTGVIYDVTQLKIQAEELQRARDELEIRVADRTRELESALKQLQDEAEHRGKIERERRELLERLVHTQEAERSRVSRELHDNLGQHMVAVLLRLDTFQRQIERSGSPSGYQFADLRAVVDGLIKATHRQSWELRPAELDELGLDVAIENLLELWSRTTGIRNTFQADRSEGELSPEMTIAFYRVAQEALTNIARHAAATEVQVRLVIGERSELRIKDNGCGFDPAATPRRLGLLGMKERLDFIGGTLVIESAPGSGTLIRASVP